MFAANGIANVSTAGYTGPDYLLITKKTYPASTTSLTLDFNPTLGGGTVQFTGHAVFNNNSGYGPQVLFDNAKSAGTAWAHGEGLPKLFAKFVFPTNVYITKIFLVPSVGGYPTYWPSSVAVYADGVLVGNYTQAASISQTDGLVMAYSGVGYIMLAGTLCTTLELVFTKGAYIDEIEIRGGLTP